MGLIHYYDNRSSFEEAVRALEPMRRTVENHLSGLQTLPGYCVACDKIVEFKIVRPASGGWINLRGSIVCPGCGLNGRNRQTISALMALRNQLDVKRAHAFERLTPMFRVLKETGLPVEGSEYVGATCPPGSTQRVRDTEVRHEDMHEISYDDGFLDLVCHFDVLEHVSDYKRALAECARVLRTGGVMIFTVPFYGHSEHQVRAELRGGQIVHHFPPAYHDNPIEAGGSLVYFIPGWPILDELRELGFEVKVGLTYDPFQGIVSDNNPHPQWLMWPVLFRATKS